MGSIKIVKMGVTKMDTDAVVNAANSELEAGGGVCGYIFQDAGFQEMTKACRAIGHCDVGNAVITPGFNLKAKYVIHAVGPRWKDGNSGEPSLLYDAYKNSLELAMKNNLHSIAFPLISAGIFRYPKAGSFRKGIRAAQTFFKHFPDYDMDVYFCVLDDETKELGEKVLKDIKVDDSPVTSAQKPDYKKIHDEGITKSTPADRMAVFQDTQNWCETDPDLVASIQKAKTATEIFYEDYYPAFNVSNTRNQTITVTGERSFEAAMRLYKEKPGSKIAVMNFANAFTPGGGVIKGAGAQEECLCRTSTLYPLLYRDSLREFYDYHKKKNSPKASDSLIYTEGVVICKTDEDFPERLPKEDWVSVDVITIAAPDLRDKSNQYAPVVGGGTYMNDAELFGYHVKRAIHVLTVAAYKGAETLVLGAFGCGAFQNNPEVVARAYKTALAEFPKVFDRVVFAVLCNPGQISKNYSVFSRVFSD